eukprot:TRINITY_DN2234_c0_g1_i1.p3 TRINITY_DN2234_c0_g1~~TRINITY_DN2234_c0_g1_i1.p3  ORF type:complete len:228 (-),score=19.29 TRINITY_DN2234_c0_g1_i1:190-873(-)
MQRGLVGSEMCIRDRYQRRVHGIEKISEKQTEIEKYKQDSIQLQKQLKNSTAIIEKMMFDLKNKSPCCVCSKDMNLYWCYSCSGILCKACTKNCSKCNNYFCENCANICSTCGKTLCKNCENICSDFENTCSNCGNIICKDCCANICSTCGKTLCKNCVNICSDFENTCSNCGKTLCKNCANVCSTCGKTLCKNCANICFNCEDIFGDWFQLQKSSLQGLQQQMLFL